MAFVADNPDSRGAEDPDSGGTSRDHQAAANTSTTTTDVTNRRRALKRGMTVSTNRRSIASGAVHGSLLASDHRPETGPRQSMSIDTIDVANSAGPLAHASGLRQTRYQSPKSPVERLFKRLQPLTPFLQPLTRRRLTMLHRVAGHPLIFSENERDRVTDSLGGILHPTGILRTDLPYRRISRLSHSNLGRRLGTLNGPLRLNLNRRSSVLGNLDAGTVRPTATANIVASEPSATVHEVTRRGAESGAVGRVVTVGTVRNSSSTASRKSISGTSWHHGTTSRSISIAFRHAS